jgi:hypothetical protein
MATIGQAQPDTILLVDCLVPGPRGDLACLPFLLNPQEEGEWVTPGMELYTKLVGPGYMDKADFICQLKNHQARESTPQEDKLLVDHHHIGPITTKILINTPHLLAIALENSVPTSLKATFRGTIAFLKDFTNFEHPSQAYPTETFPTSIPSSPNIFKASDLDTKEPYKLAYGPQSKWGQQMDALIALLRKDTHTISMDGLGHHKVRRGGRDAGRMGVGFSLHACSHHSHQPCSSLPPPSLFPDPCSSTTPPSTSSPISWTCMGALPTMCSTRKHPWTW